MTLSALGSQIPHPSPGGVCYAEGMHEPHRHAQEMKPEHKQSALNRLKTVRGHLDGVIAMVEDERYCPDIMKQVSALVGSLEKVNRVLLQNHVETCVMRAVDEGRSGEIVDELMETLRYTPGVVAAKGANS
jgi:CsoR family transcriptional regulator, copper-sensing transcriptional repressor